MHRLTSFLAGVLLLSAAALAAPQSPKKAPSIHCTLTDKKIQKCCCEQRRGKLYCKLAKKTIEKCCCEPAQFPKAKKS
jgi:hypothetical protein